MSQIVEAIYEDGVFKPKTKPDLSDRQEVRLIIEPKISIVDQTKGIIKVPAELSDDVVEIIESPNHSVLES